MKLRAKDEAYRIKSSNPDLYHGRKAELRRAIKDAKRVQRELIETKFQSSNSRELWANIGLITQYKGLKRSFNTDDPSLANKLNEFYARFDRQNNCESFPKDNSNTNTAPLVIETTSVKREFGRLDVRKAPGPDDIIPKLLKNCANELAGVYTIIFN